MAVVVKIYGWLAPHFPLLGGTALHMLYVKQTQIERRQKKKTWIGWLILIAISILIGLFAQTIAIAYFEWHDIEVKKGVVTACRVTGAALGFGGTVWIMNKLKEFAEDAKNAALDKGFKRRRKSYEYDDPYEREYRPGRRYDDEEDI